MNKKSIFIVVSVLVILFISYMIASSAITDAIDNSNKRAIELYATNIRYAYAKLYLDKSGIIDIDIDSLNVTSTVDVKCAEKKLNLLGNVELHKCRVENSKAQYKYVNGKAERE